MAETTCMWNVYILCLPALWLSPMLYARLIGLLIILNWQQVQLWENDVCLYVRAHLWLTGDLFTVYPACALWQLKSLLKLMNVQLVFGGFNRDFSQGRSIWLWISWGWACLGLLGFSTRNWQHIVAHSQNTIVKGPVHIWCRQNSRREEWLKQYWYSH